MLQAIVHWSLCNRVAVVVLAVLLLGLGLYAAGHARLDVFPEFAPPQVVIQTECPGLSPAEVEQLVTLPIETAINGISHLDTLRSQSIQGLSVITGVFQDGTDIYRARQQVTERLAELAGQLPLGVRAPRLAPLMPATGRLLTVGFTSKTLSLMELRDRVQWNVRPHLLAVPGVAQVTIYGGDVRQFQVQVFPDALAARNLALTDVLDATRQASAIRGAGFIENDRQRIVVRAAGQVRSAAELGETVLASGQGTPVRLRDVARVREAAEPKFGDALINGEPGVVLVIFRQLEGDTAEVTRHIEAALERLLMVLERQGITYYPALFRQANFIETAINNVRQSILMGALLVAVVLFVFLYNWRTAAISLTAIPLSLLTAIVVLWTQGIGLNTLTLGGLAIAVGEVVDDAIIDVENIFRRLRQNARLAQPQPALKVVLSASLEVRNAVVYATFVVVLVFVPVFFLTGLQGRLFAPLAQAYVLAVLASLIVALTVTPALALLLLPRTQGAIEPPLLKRLHAGYDRLLRRIDGELPLVVTVAALLFLGAGIALWSFGGKFLPELRESHFVVHMHGIPGTSLEQSLAAGKRVTARLKREDMVRSISQQSGRAELGEDTFGVHYSEVEVDLLESGAEDIEKAEQQLRRLFAIPGFNTEVMAFLSERIMETLSGSPQPVVVTLHGDDLTALDQTAKRVAAVLEGVPGHDAVRAERQTGVPELTIRIRQEDAARFGLRRAQILDTIHAAYQGAEVGQVYDRNRIVDIVVILEPSARRDPDQVANLWVSLSAAKAERVGNNGTSSAADTVTGNNRSPLDHPPPARLQLKQVADVTMSDGRFMISHQGGLRRQLVTCNVQGRDVESFVTEARSKVGMLTLPQGVTVTFAGEYEAKQTAQRELLLLSLAAGAGIVLLLWLAFGSLRHLLLILINLPFALIGGVAAVFMNGGILDVGSLIGFVTLFGITTRNSIMMISHWQHLHEAEGMPWGPELVFRGARERLAPVLMTALVTGLGLLPIALGSGEAGREIEGPMALVILGGLVTSTALNLLVLPVLYRFSRSTRRASEAPSGS
jgi:CzcA family heavy metal efflux pump